MTPYEKVEAVQKSTRALMFNDEELAEYVSQFDSEEANKQKETESLNVRQENSSGNKRTMR